MKSLLAVIGLTVAAANCFTSLGQIDITDADDNTVRPTIPEADRYTNGRVFLERAARLLKPSDTVDYQVVVDDVMFRRGDMYMYCDSAHFYDLTNSLEAFGNVRMEQGDTLFVYADRMVYTDSIELAVLYSESNDPVKLINRDVTLLTDVFYYDLGIDLGYYETGGELTDNQNRLTSVYGEYAPQTKDAVFKEKVHLNSRSKSDTLNIFTDDLRYNTDTHIAELTAPSTITSRDGIIYTDLGVYNTETTIADLYERSLVITSTGRTLTGDTLFYDHRLGYGEAWGNMVLNDTINHTRLLGDYGFYNELTDSAFVTGHALAVDYSSADSLSLHGDTIQAFRVINFKRKTVMVPASSILPDSTVAVPEAMEPPAVLAAETSQETSKRELPEQPQPENSATTEETQTEEAQTENSATAEESDYEGIVSPTAEITEQGDSIEVAELIPHAVEIPDTTRHIVAYPHVRFFRSDLQGVCDSMTYVQKDSIIYLDRDPLVWSGNRQIFGKRILVHLNDSTADKIILPETGFTAEMIEEGFYNQMSGREMVALLENGSLRHLDVSGNVLIVFFPINEEDSTYTKVANAESSFLAADFKDQNIEKLKMWSQSNETITPLYLAKKSLFFLPGFRWEAWRRPKGHDDLFAIPVDPNAPVEEEMPATSPDVEPEAPAAPAESEIGTAAATSAVKPPSNDLQNNDNDENDDKRPTD